MIVGERIISESLLRKLREIKEELFPQDYCPFYYQDARSGVAFWGHAGRFRRWSRGRLGLTETQEIIDRFRLE